MFSLFLSIFCFDHIVDIGWIKQLDLIWSFDLTACYYHLYEYVVGMLVYSMHICDAGRNVWKRRSRRSGRRQRRRLGWLSGRRPRERPTCRILTVKHEMTSLTMSRMISLHSPSLAVISLSLSLFLSNSTSTSIYSTWIFVCFLLILINRLFFCCLSRCAWTRSLS